MPAYDKGFGGPGPTPHGQRHRQEPTRHGVAATPRHPHRDFGERAPSHTPHGAPAKGPRAARPWASHAGRVGAIGAAVGAVAGLASLVAWGNWAAPIVLPVVLGVAGAILFWIPAMVADTIRGIR